MGKLTGGTEMNPIDHLTKKQKETLVSLVENQEVELNQQNRFIMERLVKSDLAFRNQRTETVVSQGKVRKGVTRMVAKIFFVASPLGHRLVDAILEEPPTPREPEKKEVPKARHQAKSVERSRVGGTSMRKEMEKEGRSSFARFKAMKQVNSL